MIVDVATTVVVIALVAAAAWRQYGARIAAVWRAMTGRPR